MPMFAIWRDAVIALGLPGLSSGVCASLEFDSLRVLDKPDVRRLGSAVIQMPEKSGFPSASRGAGPDIFTVPSAFRGTPALG